MSQQLIQETSLLQPLKLGCELLLFKRMVVELFNHIIHKIDLVDISDVI